MTDSNEDSNCSNVQNKENRTIVACPFFKSLVSKNQLIQIYNLVVHEFAMFYAVRASKTLEAGWCWYYAERIFFSERNSKE